jgi:hypothetical protein
VDTNYVIITPPNVNAPGFSTNQPFQYPGGGTWDIIGRTNTTSTAIGPLNSGTGLSPAQFCPNSPTYCDLGWAPVSYTAPSRNSTGDVQFGSSGTGAPTVNVAFNNMQMSGQAPNLTFMPNSASGNSIVNVQFVPQGTSSQSGFAMFFNSNMGATQQNLFESTSSGLSLLGYGFNTKDVYGNPRNTLDNGSGAASFVGSVTAPSFCISTNCVSSLWSNPMTTLGDLLYGGTSGAATRLAGNTSTTPMYLKSVGSGSTATAPTLAQIQFSDIAGTLGIGAGGTGQSTASAAFNALSPLTTEGDLHYYHSSSNTRLAIGGASTFLTSNGTDPAWGSLTGAGFGSQTANTFLAAPNGSSGNPSFRTLVAADLPASITSNTTGNAATATNLASYPTLCSGGQFSQGLSSGSNNCATPSGGASPTNLGALTYNASGTTTFAAASGAWVFAAVTQTHNTGTTLNPTGLVAGGQYSLEWNQDSTGGGTETITLSSSGSCSSGWKVAQVGGAGGYPVTTTISPNSTGANGTDYLFFTLDAANYCVATWN